ncbi:Protein translocase subunit SecA [Labeo rohita]|uniref:Protein translocase subunit SecA n=1 Tax=Labeo rohita TaxID=84645 RepID=A0ABQ8L058_LABRO|nr:Protein translocase subunit SecA [Labeo rohita]
MDNKEPGDEMRSIVERSFYVDNCLWSLSSPQEAKQLVDKMCKLLATGGFQLHHWASNVSSVIEHLSNKARSDSTELWLCQSDTFEEPKRNTKGDTDPKKISFHFNPPKAPHFGGAWEREICSVETALRITIGSQTVTEEVLLTVLIEVEGVLNSKPLEYTSSSVADFDPVTPSYMLMGRPDSSLSPVVYPTTELMGRGRWRQNQVLTDQFWSSFIRHYLPALQARHKWHTDVSDISPGTTAMLVDPQLPRAMWLVGKVVKTFPGSDGHIRAVEIQVKNKTYTQPVARLIPSSCP